MSLDALSHSTRPAPTFGQRLLLAIPPVLRGTLVALAISGLLLPGNTRLPRFVFPLLFGFPLVLTAFRRGERAAFRWWASYALAFISFVLLRFYADDWGPPYAIGYAITADRLLGFGEVPTLALQQAFYQYGHSVLLPWLAIAVHLSYYAAPPLVGVLLWAGRSPRFPRYIATLILIFAISLIVHVLVPTAPPWLAGLRGDLPRVYRVIFDVLYKASPDFYTYGNHVAAGNDVAAMPSVHMAAAAAIGLVSWSVGGWPRLLGAAYAVLMAVSLSYLGEHYLIDSLAGAGVAVLAWCAAGIFLRASTPHLDRAAPPGLAPAEAGEFTDLHVREPR